MKKKELRDRNGLTEAEYLSSYEPGDYVRPSVAADMVIFTVMETEEENYRKLPEKVVYHNCCTIRFIMRIAMRK